MPVGVEALPPLEVELDLEDVVDVEGLLVEGLAPRLPDEELEELPEVKAPSSIY
ncbi:MAG: hypothetical protein J6S53_10095 [Lentisphaeria bacterium]|nr:hypothetical protein [Lentisphaeria bacterium]